ncbi:MAG: tetratricopeptide repeat protein, partial [Nitrospiraceae bacterium]
MSVTFSRLAILLLFAISSSTLAASDAPPRVMPACESAESCFQDALVSSDPSAPSFDQVRRKIDNLRTVQERHPGSIWAKRAGLLTGILLIGPDPAEAVRLFKLAQRDWPLLEEYIRFWTGEALLKAGDASLAAAVFETIPETVPDTLLVTRALFRSGEAWARAGQCRKAIDPLTRAVSRGPQ